MRRLSFFVYFFEKFTKYIGSNLTKCYNMPEQILLIVTREKTYEKIHYGA